MEPFSMAWGEGNKERNIARELNELNQKAKYIS